MNSGRWSSAAAAAVLWLAGCPSSAPPADATVASVGTRSIEASDLTVVLRGMADQGEMPRGADFGELRRRTLEARIVEEVLLDEAERRSTTVAPDALNAEVAAHLGEPANAAVLEAAIALYGSEAAWHRVIARRMTLTAIEQTLRTELTKGTAVTPEQVDAALPRYAERLDRPARLRARQFFDEDPLVVRALHARLEAGEDFTALAREAGDEGGGELGFMTEDDAPSLLVQACAGLAPGEHTAVLRSPLGYHVFQLVARTPAGSLPDEAARELAETWLVDEAVDSRLRAWLALRSKELGLTVYEDVLDAVRCCRDGVPYLALSKEKS